MGNSIGQVLVRYERRVAAVYQVSGRRSLPNLGLLDPEKVPDPDLELSQSLFQRFHLSISHLVLVDSDLDQSHVQGQNLL